MSQPTNGTTGRESGFGFRTAAVLLATGGSTALFLQAITVVLAPLTGSGAGDRAALIAVALVWIGIGMVLAGPFRLPPPPAYLGALEILKGIWAAALVLLVPAALPLLAGIGPAAGSAALLRWGLAGLLLFPFGILAGLAQAAAVYRLAGRPDAERMIDSTGAVLLAGGAAGLAAGGYLLAPLGGSWLVLFGGLLLGLAAAVGWWRWGGGVDSVAAPAEPTGRLPGTAIAIGLVAGFALGAAVPAAMRPLANLFGPTWRTSWTAGLVVLLGLAAGWSTGGQYRRSGRGVPGSLWRPGAVFPAAAGLAMGVVVFEPLAAILAPAYQLPDGLFPFLRLGVSALFLAGVGFSAGALTGGATGAAHASNRPAARMQLPAAAALLGAGAGLVMGAWLLIPHFGSRWTLLGLAAAAWIGGSFALSRGGSGWRRLAVPAGVVIGAVGLWAAPGWSPGILNAGLFRYADLIAARFESGSDFLALRRSDPPEFFREAVTGSVGVESGEERGRKGRYLTIDGSVEESWSQRMLDDALAGHVALLLRPEAAANPEVALFGLGAGVAARSILLYEIAGLTVIEPEPAVRQAFRHFSDTDDSLLDDPRVRLVFSDPRSFLSVSAARFDLVLSRGPEPGLQRGAFLYTEEFFRQVRRHLQPQGMQLHRLPLVGLAAGEFAAIIRAFVSVYPDAFVVELTSRHLALLGTDAPWRLPLAEIERRFMQPDPLAHLTRLGIPAPTSVLGRFGAGGDDLVGMVGAGPVQTDRRVGMNRFPRRAGLDEARHLLQRIDLAGTRIVPFLSDDEEGFARGDFLYELGKTLIVRGAYGLAADLATEMDRLGSVERAGWLRGQLALQAGDRERALALWEAVLENDSEHLDALLSLGGYFQDFGLYHAAEEYLRRLAAAYPERPLALFQHGQNLYHLMQDEEARIALEKVVEGGGESIYSATLFYLGKLASRNDRDDEAIDYLSRYLARSYRIGPLTLTDADAHDTLGIVYLRLDQKDLADRHDQAARRLTEELLRNMQDQSQN